jgi:sulfonate transport system permease protein
MAMRERLTGRDWRGAVLPLVLIAIWTAVTAFGWVNTQLIVPPSAVLAAAWHFVATGHFFSGLAASLGRDLVGFVLGGIAGISLGILMGVSRWAERLIGPSFHTLKQISLFAWLPLISTWLGSGDGAKISLIALSAFYPAALGAFEGIRGVTQAWFEVARVHAFTRAQTLYRLVLPAAAPQIATGLHLALIYAWLATVGGEFLLANHGVGIGDAVMRGRVAFDVALVVFGMLVIGLVGASCNRLAGRLEARLLHWRGTLR